jgi:hypothetical protein
MAMVEVNEVKTIRKVYVLTLTQDEAETILAITGKVSGSPVDSRRKHSEAVFYALRSANVPLKSDDLMGLSIYFNSVHDHG